MQGVEIGTKSAGGKSVAEITAVGRALSDPIRVRMLGMMAGGRECCGLRPSGAPTGAGEAVYPGICVCEFVDYFGMSQSKISYHLGRIKEAGLVEEWRLGKWRYYSLRKEAVDGVLKVLAAHMGQDEA
ncbi:MAG: ArsR/SmtB family transcription factor [Rubrobacteraceae bacterium]